MHNLKIMVRVEGNRSITEISGGIIQEAFESVLKDENYRLLSQGIAHIQGGFTEAEYVSSKLIRAGYDVKLDKNEQNLLKEQTIFWLGY